MRSPGLPASSPASSYSRPTRRRRCACRAERSCSSDGPFIDAKEHVGGFYLIEADELDEALEIAARIPVVRYGGAVEVRPVLER